MKIALLGYGKNGPGNWNCKGEEHEIVLKRMRTTLMKDYQPQM
jgi:hypothetical protein